MNKGLKATHNIPSEDPRSALKPAVWGEGFNDAVSNIAWDVLSAISIPAIESPSNSVLKMRFRLAGTFFAITSDGKEVRKAVIDDSQKREQMIVGEKDSIDEVVIEAVFLDHIILRQGQIREEIWLSLLTKPQGSSATAKTDANTMSSSSTSNKFGVKVGDNSWSMNKGALMSYYRELMDDPSRMVQVFDSLEPVYAQSGRRIAGYQLAVKGEADFFKSVGLEQGDIVRRVNGMEMSSRRRAEYLIGEFASDRANAFVMDIERNGQSTKLIYQLK